MGEEGGLREVAAKMISIFEKAHKGQQTLIARATEERESLADQIMTSAAQMDAEALRHHAHTFFRKTDRSRAQYLAALWLLKTHNVMVEERTDILRTYDSERGFYTATGEAVLKAALVSEYGRYLARGTTGEALHFVRAKALVRDREIDATTPPNLLCCRNGVLDIDTLKLYPHTPERYFLTGLPIAWNPTATCPAIEKYFSEVVTPADRERILDFFGLALYRRHFLEKFWILVGGGSNGKSRIPVLATALVGTENAASVTLQQLSDNGTVAAAQLYGKFVNVAGDISGGLIKDAAWLKALTGGDPLTAAGKYERHFQFTNYATMLFSSNDPPRFAEDTLGLWRRPVLIRFANQFGTAAEVTANPDVKLADPHLDTKLTAPEELDGLLVLAVEALRNILARKSLSQQTTTDATRTEYRRISDPAGAFLEEACETADYLPGENGNEPEGAIPTADLYQAFRAFCREHGVKVQSADWFAKRLKRIPEWDLETDKVYFAGVRKRAIKGLRFKPAWPSSPRFPIVSPITPIRSPTPEKERNVGQTAIFTYKLTDEKPTSFFGDGPNLPEEPIETGPMPWLQQQKGPFSKDLFLQTFGETELEQLLHDGVISEPRPGLLEVVR